MAKKSPRRRPQHDSDYDGAWKAFLRLHFRAFMLLFFPATYAEIDWSVEPEWLDKELSQVLGSQGERNRLVDVLVKVRYLTGEDRCILLHVEIQTSSEQDFELRVSQYNRGLWWTFQRPVISLVILADLDSDWMPSEFVFKAADYETRTLLKPCKIVRKLEKEWKDEKSLPVEVARAQIAALRTASDPEGRFNEKWRLVRSLYDAGYNQEQLREIFRLIDWMMHLRPDLEEKFERDLIEMEAKLNMPYVTSVERIAQARGEARGEARGKAATLVAILRQQVDSLPTEIADRIHQLPAEKLDLLTGVVTSFQDVEAMESWLADHETSGESV